MLLSKCDNKALGYPLTSYACVSGSGSYSEASKLFNSKGFPVVSRMNGKKIAYKYDVAKFLGIGYGVNDLTPNEEILKLLNEILIELKEKNEFVVKVIK